MDSPQDTKLLQIVDALAPFSPDGAMTPQMREALAGLIQKLGQAESLELTPDEELLGADNAMQARLTYTVGYKRLLDILRIAPQNFNEREAQARIALGYIRHAEGNNLKVLQLGRHVADDQVLKQLQELRAKVNTIAEHRAQNMAKKMVADAASQANPGGTEST